MAGSIELKPCPFCGADGIKLTYDGKGYLIECSGCKAETDVYDTAYDAVVAWNRRTEV